MAINLTGSNIISGLGTFSHVTLASIMYTVLVRVTEIPDSSLQVTITQSGSTSVTVNAPLPVSGQNNINLRAQFNCVAGDLISVVLSSAAPIDNQFNNVKSSIYLRQGL